jgi:DNA polymerase-1
VARRRVDIDKQISEDYVSKKSTEELRDAKVWLNSFLEMRKAQKLYNTYVKGIRRATDFNGHDKVYVDYRMDGTLTGRLSCASYSAGKDMGVSFHTLPREDKHNIRKMFTAPTGWSFIAADYAAMELRVLAHISKEKKMQQAFTDGVDLHTYTASLLFQKSEDKIKKDERQIAKAVSFLIAYGGGAYRLSETTGITYGRAEKIIQKYAEVYPGIFGYMDFVHDFIRKNEYAYTLFGRRRHLPDVRSRDSKIVQGALRQGLNFTIQSAASDILLCAIKGITESFKGLNAKIVATVHDSIEIIAPHDEVKEVLEIVYDEMVNYKTVRKDFGIEFNLPLKIDAEVGTSFGDGKEVHFENGVPIL